MSKQESNARKAKKSQSTEKNPTTIESLIAGLADKSSETRRSARNSLIAIGEPAVPALIVALAHRSRLVRSEAAKALGQIRAPISTHALVKALGDKDFDVRWLAAEGLIAIGKESLVPLLKELVQNSEYPWLRDGAHHVLSHFARSDTNIEHHDLSHPIHRSNLSELLKPLVLALEGFEPSIEVPWAAKKALDELMHPGGGTGSK
jgi:hypothetical protein